MEKMGAIFTLCLSVEPFLDPHFPMGGVVGV